MPVISAPQEFNTEDLYVNLREMYGFPLHLKCEGFNFAGSIKLKAAASMIEAAERSGELTQDSILVESSSGNLGVALSVIAAAKGYRFICVVDSRTNLATRKVIESLGSEVHTVSEPAAEGDSSRPGSPTSRGCWPPARAMSGSTSTPTRTTGGPTTAPPLRRSRSSSRNWSCCSSAPAPPAP